MGAHALERDRDPPASPLPPLFFFLLLALFCHDAAGPKQ
jgi:hypothetical protein